MTSPQDYYAILQVQANADLETIKRAYRKKIRLYHPDQFVAELSKVRQTGNAADVRKIETQIQLAKEKTQRLNEAYAILSDTTDRAAYDQLLSDMRQRQYHDEIRRQRMQHWEGERRTVKSRPHHQNPNIRRRRSDESIPWAILAGLIILILFVSALFSNAITRSITPHTTFVPRNPTSEGSLLASELQATANAERITRIARSTIAFQPTLTPRSSSDNEALGDQFMNFGHVARAINAYAEAIEADGDNANLYLKRAVAYADLYMEGDADAFENALADYSQAIVFDTTLADAYLGRGMLYYALWVSGEDYADEVRSDLEAYLMLANVTDGEAIQSILDELP